MSSYMEKDPNPVITYRCCIVFAQREQDYIIAWLSNDQFKNINTQKFISWKSHLKADVSQAKVTLV